MLSNLISSDVSSVKVNGVGETMELSESELADFFEITKEIEYYNHHQGAIFGRRK